MKYIIFFIITFTLVAYILWPSKQESEDLISFKEPEKMEVKKKIVSKSSPEAEAPKPMIKKSETKKELFTKQDEAEYFTKIRDIIKDQWKELEDCEAEFDERFGPILKLTPDKQKEYFRDPSNLDDFLDKLATFNGTTPSSAKMIRGLAEPIVDQVDKDEIMDTVGYVKTCRDYKKSDLLWNIVDVKKKNKKLIKTVLNFLEREISTLTYPNILYSKVIMLKNFLVSLNLKGSKYPGLNELYESYQAYNIRTSKMTYNSNSFNPELQKEGYKFAIVYQKQIQQLIKTLKKDLLE